MGVPGRPQAAMLGQIAPEHHGQRHEDHVSAHHGTRRRGQQEQLPGQAADDAHRGDGDARSRHDQPPGLVGGPHEQRARPAGRRERQRRQESGHGQPRRHRRDHGDARHPGGRHPAVRASGVEQDGVGDRDEEGGDGPSQGPVGPACGVHGGDGPSQSPVGPACGAHGDDFTRRSFSAAHAGSAW